jgi:hypothetical protein
MIKYEHAIYYYSGGYRMKNDIKAYLNQNKSKNFSELLFSYIDETGCKDSEIYKKVDIDRKLFSKIRCGDYIPKRSNVIKLCLSLRLDKVKFNNLLNSAGYSLNNNTDFDLIISYCIENNIYDFNIINDYLYTFTNTVL